MKGPNYMEEMVMETLKASDLSLIPEKMEVDFDDEELLEAFQIAQSQIHLKNYRCLLYTSPSPRDGLLSRMPSSA